MPDDEPVILVVEDEPDLADLYATWLKPEYRVLTAYGGKEAVENLDEEIDVVFLDRRMPNFPGDEVLEEIHDRDIDCSVSMVSAVEPDFGILDMNFDTYLIKPINRKELVSTVEDLVARNSYEKPVQKLYSLTSKKTLLEIEKGHRALSNNTAYQELCAEIDSLKHQVNTPIDSLE